MTLFHNWRTSFGRRARVILITAGAAILLQPASIRALDGAPSVGALAVDPEDPLTIYAATVAGVYKTTDGGTQWALIAPHLQGAHTLLLDPTTPSILVAGVGPRGIFRSTDGGSTWTSIGISYWWEPSLTIDPKTGTLYVTVDEFGVLTWDSNGKQWVGVAPVQWLPGEYGWIYSVAVQAPFMYVGAFYGNWDVAATAVHSTIDGTSGTIAELNTYPPTDAVSVDAIALDPANPTTAYASVQNDGLFKTTDGRATWFRDDSLPSGVRNILRDPSLPGTLYAVYSTSVAKSDDGGNSWKSAHVSLTETLVSSGVSGDVTGFAIHPQITGTLYAATAIGVFSSTDGGSHWTPTGLVSKSLLAR